MWRLKDRSDLAAHPRFPTNRGVWLGRRRVEVGSVTSSDIGKRERERERAKSMMLGRVFFKGGIVEEAPLCRARHDVTGEEASGQDAL